ncbi:hypothetical protein [Halorubrum salinum]|nr:hypothetical protein [Halorubrum salinum]
MNTLREFRDSVIVDSADHIHAATESLDVHMLVRRYLSVVENSVQV